MDHLRLSRHILQFATNSSTQNLYRGTSANDDCGASLSMSGYDDMIAASKKKPQMVWCFAEWCGHCRAMKQDWIHAVTDKKSQQVANWYNVDCTTPGGKAFAAHMGVASYPTVYRFYGSAKPQIHTGELKSAAFIHFARVGA